MIVKPLKHVFFDLDGTLIDITHRWYHLHVDLSRIYGYTPMRKEMYIALKRDGVHEKDVIKKTNIPRKKINDYLKKRNQHMESKTYLAKDKLKSGVKKLLKTLAESRILLLFTRRKHKRRCIEELNRLGIKKYFAEILVASSPSQIRSFMRSRDKSILNNALLIGDTEDDYHTARTLRMPCICVCDGARNKEYLSRLKPRPSHIVDRFDQIRSLLRL